MDDSTIIKYENDIVINWIGSGTYGSVEKVKNNGFYYARKSIKVVNNLNKIIDECFLLKSLKHTNISSFQGCCYDETNQIFYIYTKFYEKGDLFDVIRSYGSNDIPNEILLKFMMDIVKGLNYIHKKNIIHRDLKTSNIFVGDNNDLVIGDFGLALQYINSDDRFTGTYSYIAPELWLSDPPKYDCYTDIFALGCIFYELYTLKLLYPGDDNKNLIKNKILDKNYHISFDRTTLPPIIRLEKLIKKMLSNIAKDRGSLDEIENELISINSDISTFSYIKIESSKSVSISLSTMQSVHLSLIVYIYIY